ncbi:energy transducer TonB [Sphingomonas sp. ASV193]|uniref:energy transducer TonB n=1 Tax=Sphingomonas sp. ASV193 TaxID=3144405 RepID=UPI0032E85F82
MIFVMLLQAATATSPAAVPVKPSQNYASLMRDDDYPQDALDKHETGTVRFAIDIAPDGRVAQCTITQSSGSASLDRRTCDIIRKRARYAPPVDSNGKPATGHDVSSVSWYLP